MPKASGKDQGESPGSVGSGESAAGSGPPLSEMDAFRAFIGAMERATDAMNRLAGSIDELVWVQSGKQSDPFPDDDDPAPTRDMAGRPI